MWMLSTQRSCYVLNKTQNFCTGGDFTHLPHDDAEAPGVGGAGELPEGDGLGGCPPYGDLAAPGGVGAVDAAVTYFSAIIICY